VASLLRGGRGASDESREEIEELLLQADVPVRLVDEWLEALERDGRRGVSRVELLKQRLLAAFVPADPMVWRRPDGPVTLLVVGVNGSGKTTTCAKLAGMVKAEGLRPMLGAADTFRAAGSDQLKLWADRLGCDVVGGRQGADAAAVAYDALDAALARKSDVVIVDTAGRMHTRQPLMEELRKVSRSMGKRLEGAPMETWAVLDATLGQNAVEQARVFNEVVPLTGVIISKLDGSAKAGFVFSLVRELKCPVRYVGLGEAAEDLVPFDPARFVEALFAVGEESGEGED